MKYDFTSIMDRHGHDALAVDAIGNPGGFAPGAPAEGFDVIPMWVADMNFPTARLLAISAPERNILIQSSAGTATATARKQ